MNINTPPRPTMSQGNDNGMSMQQPMRRGRSHLIEIILVIIVIAALIFAFRNNLHLGANKASAYQAVFLTNGQVYFGKLSHPDDDYVKLTDIFYLQVNQPLQSGQTPAAQQAQPQLSLVKLGNELHGPTDEMSISRAQVLFLEDLKPDGKVAQAIAAYKANPNGTPAAQTPAAQTPATPAPAPTK